MANERPGGRRQGRPGGGGGYGDFRPRRSGPPRGGPPRGGSRGSFGDEAPRDFVPRPQREPYPSRSGGGYPARSPADERGPSTAAELAIAIRERGRYQPPRSGKPLDAATVNSRVSNPVYRARFRRAEGRISLAE